jgi:hypothetical protein
MHILLDECLPRKLKRALSGHHVATVPEQGWASIKNGALLRLAEPLFDVFITADQNLQYQQNLQSAQLGIVVLVASNTRLETLLPLIPNVQTALQAIQPGDVVRIA